MPLLVMRLTDMHRVHPEQDNSRVCAECGHQVGIYPSGQAELARHPAMRIICNRCLEPGDVIIPVPGVARELSESVPAEQGKPVT